MKHDRRWFGAVVCAVVLCTGLLGAGCGGSDDSDTYPPGISTSNSGGTTPGDNTSGDNTSGNYDPNNSGSGDYGSSTPGGSCTGSARICAMFSQTLCNTQPGCAWLYSMRMCTGAATPCYSASTQDACSAIQGCTWQ